MQRTFDLITAKLRLGLRCGCKTLGAKSKREVSRKPLKTRRTVNYAVHNEGPVLKRTLLLVQHSVDTIMKFIIIVCLNWYFGSEV